MRAGQWAVLGVVTEWGDSISDVIFSQKSQRLVKRHSYFMQTVCGLTVLKLKW